ncbi:alpha/beta hydrolase [Microbacterium sediminicola]|uniref:alpha/beta hydrolase n=1 Tax=Microbacterium sediminicola TaxID=415210 RepID=UPI0031D1AD49
MLERPAPPPDRTLAYDARASAVVDVFDPVGEPSGLAVVLHGGFWRAAYDRVHLRCLAAALADRTGMTIALPEYRRVGEPGGGVPGTLEDVAAIFARVPASLGVGASQTVVVGHSAGGHLAVLGAIGATTAPRRVVCLAGVLDLAAAHAARLSNGAVAELLGEYDPSTARVAAIDPMRLPVPACDVVLIHGERDDEVPVDYSRAYARRLDRDHGGGMAGGSAPRGGITVLPEADHYDVIDPHSSAFDVVARAIRVG